MISDFTVYLIAVSVTVISTIFFLALEVYHHRQDKKEIEMRRRRLLALCAPVQRREYTGDPAEAEVVSARERKEIRATLDAKFGTALHTVIWHDQRGGIPHD